MVRLCAAIALIALAACLDVGAPQPTSQVRVINASSGQIDIYVDGIVQLQGVDVSNVSAIILPPGPHQLRFQTAGGLATTLPVTTADGGITTTYAFSPSATTLGATLLDTGGVVPAGKSKLRVSHLSKAVGNIEIWRTQPDFQTPTHIQTPFPYLATSPFIQSDSGSWEVFITAPGSTAKLLTTGLIHVASLGKRTVVLLDSAGVAVFRVLPE